MPPKKAVFGRFFGKKSFPGKTVDFHLYHVLQIMKAIGPEVNLSYQSSLLKHPTRRQNFANTVDTLCAHYLTLRPNWLLALHVSKHNYYKRKYFFAISHIIVIKMGQ